MQFFLLKRKLGVTYVRGVRGCTTDVAVGKDEPITLPRVSATHTTIIGTPIRNLPPCRHVHRLTAIFNKRAIIDFVTMQGHVQVGAVALRGVGGPGGGGGRLRVSSSARVSMRKSRRGAYKNTAFVCFRNQR